jgi:tetratricopeptide (TPR) repeat protein
MVKSYSQQGKAKELLGRLSNLADQHPKNAGIHVLLGLTRFESKDLPGAERSARTAVALDPKMATGYVLLGNINNAQGHLSEAKANFGRAIEASPSNVTNYMALEAIHKKEGNWAEAIRLVERARKIAPDSPWLAAELGFLFLEHGGDAHQALALAQAARARLPESPAVADTLGWAHFKLGALEPAVRELSRAVQAAPTNAVYQHHLGMAQLASGNTDAAKSALQKSLRQDPSYAKAAGVAEALERAERAVAKGKG